MTFRKFPIFYGIFQDFFAFWCFPRYEPQNEYLLSYRHCWAHGKPRTFVQCLWHNISDGERAKTWKRLLWTCCLSFFWVGWVVTWCTLFCIFLSTLGITACGTKMGLSKANHKSAHFGCSLARVFWHFIFLRLVNGYKNQLLLLAKFYFYIIVWTVLKIVNNCFISRIQ